MKGHSKFLRLEDPGVLGAMGAGAAQEEEPEAGPGQGAWFRWAGCKGPAPTQRVEGLLGQDQEGPRGLGGT